MSDTDFHDRFDRAFNERIPRDVAQSFTQEQRSAIRTAFGGERWHGHPVDLRGTLPLLRWYYVFVAGPDRRSKRRRRLDDTARPSLVGRVVGAVTMTVMLVLLATLLIYVMVT